MTEEELQIITDRVIDKLRKDSVMIEQLENTNALTGSDLLELDKGRNVTLDDLRKFIRGFGIYLEIIAREDNEAVPSDYNVFSASRTLKEISRNLEDMKQMFIRKDQEDQTDYLLKFGEFIDSMVSGVGTGIFPDGRIQTDRLEVRGSMTIMDLIINELHAMAGDYEFSDCGKIRKVEDMKNGTYKIWMERELRTDVTNFEEHDVLRSIVNTLRMGGKDYFTSWFRPVSGGKNTTENSLIVVLYPDAEVPGGKNFAPVAGFNVARRGNAVLPEEGKVNERAQSWLISSREGRIMFLQNVFKPILEQYNYALALGKLPNLDVIDRLGLTDSVGLYAQSVVCERLHQIDWNGDVVCNKVDRGEWSEEIAKSEENPYRFIQHEKTYPGGKRKYTELEQHTVYHYGCKWACLVDKTQLEPVWNSTDWNMIEGDTNYHLNFESTRGWQFHINDIGTEITASVWYANRDITKDVMALPSTQVSWLRSTNPDGTMNETDLAWNNAHNNIRNVIELTRDDMGSGWGFEYRKVMFVCKVFFPVGEKTEVAENQINVKL